MISRLFKPKAPTITMDAHARKCEYYEARIASLRNAVNREQAAARYYAKTSLAHHEEAQSLRSELAPLKAARAKQLANLTQNRKAAKSAPQCPHGDPLGKCDDCVREHQEATR